MRFANLHAEKRLHPFRCVCKGGIHEWALHISASQRPTHQRQWNNGAPKGTLVLAISSAAPQLLCWRIQEDHHLLNNSYTENPDLQLQVKIIRDFVAKTHLCHQGYVCTSLFLDNFYGVQRKSICFTFVIWTNTILLTHITDSYFGS